MQWRLTSVSGNQSNKFGSHRWQLAQKVNFTPCFENPCVCIAFPLVWTYYKATNFAGTLPHEVTFVHSCIYIACSLYIPISKLCRKASYTCMHGFMLVHSCTYWGRTYRISHYSVHIIVLNCAGTLPTRGHWLIWLQIIHIPAELKLVYLYSWTVWFYAGTLLYILRKDA